MPGSDDEEWFDKVNRDEDAARREYFADKDSKLLKEAMDARGVKAHECPFCHEVFECK